MNNNSVVKMDMQAGNELIAKFMGEQFIEFHGMICRCGEDESPWDYDPIEWLQYDINWNLLMQVVEKIHDECKLPGYTYGLKFFINLTIFCGIETLWQAVVQFIIWYNNQTPQP
jgi:hypothetical protein